MSSHEGESLETAPAFASGPSWNGDGDGSEEAPAGEEELGGGEAPPPRRRFSRRLKILVGVGVFLAVAVLVASLVSLPYYAITPGSAQSVLPLIGVPPSLEQHHAGEVQLVDVEVTPIHLIDWLYFKLDPNASIYSSQEIQGPETNAQYNTEGVLDMSDAQQAASVVALEQLGYHVTVIPNGSLVYALDPGSPAEAALQVGDVIVSVGTTKVNSPAELSAALAGYRIGEAVILGYRPYPSGAKQTTTLHTGVWRVEGTGSNAQLSCVPANVRSSLPIARLYDDDGVLYAPSKAHPGGPTPCVGILDAEPSYFVKLPFPVNLQSEGIVGPSAGLAFTLGVMQKLDPANLTNGMKIAATGTMSVQGQIGAIGGIQQKTIAVRSSGASIFFVPPANYPIAKQYAGSHLKVYAVSSIEQVIGILESHGGKVVKAATSSP